ncbi:succinate dehydrogenase hydrophobic membrane anchor subunit [Streptomyces oryzae]|uniref:succinate dehydrogenase hydrophobic membrane anchor subunit n=1 Tax=Streptomyces oryzae TaxID=1434886 RepID=UPI001FFE22B9|nr:succinate dehydrogenase hydrophobic membrane anchor subunit [Streptomyces oryzae]
MSTTETTKPADAGSDGPTGPQDDVALFDVDHPAPVIEPPRKRTAKTPKASRGNFEMQAWLFMRLSGIVLVVLVLGHLLIQLVLDGGVSKIGFAFVAGRWASPFWQVWDLLMLWLAMLHGANGLRTVINDYAERDNTRFWLKMLLYTATVFTVLLGTLVIFTFDPNIR